DVRNLDSLQLAPLILGPAGSTVRLGFLAAIPRDNVGGVYYVNVQRSVSNTAPDPLDACEADPCASPAAFAATEGAQQEGHVWYIRKSRSSGKRYYSNATTGSTTWELPAHVPWDQVLEATDMRELHDAMSLSSLKQRLTPSVTPSSSFSSKSTAFCSSKSFSDSNTSLPQVHDEIMGRMQHETRSPTSRTPSPVRDPKTPSPVRGPKTPGFATDRVNDCVRKKLQSELEDFTLNAKSESS
ncbi:MAG: WW domain-containing protein, partial [Promethearchaeia archaeon]